MKEININISTYYCEDDFEFNSDYTHIILSIDNPHLQNGQIYLKRFGNHYHDKGQDKLEACIEMFKHLYKDKYIIHQYESKHNLNEYC